MALLGPLRGEVTPDEPPPANPPPGETSRSSGFSAGRMVFFAAAAFGLFAIFRGKSDEDLDGF